MVIIIIRKFAIWNHDYLLVKPRLPRTEAHQKLKCWTESCITASLVRLQYFVRCPGTLRYSSLAMALDAADGRVLGRLSAYHCEVLDATSVQWSFKL